MAWMLRTTPPCDQQESGGLCMNTSTTLYRASDRTPLPTPAPPLWQCCWLWLPRNEPGATMLIAHLRPMESFPACLVFSNLSKCVLTKSGCPNGVPKTLMPRRCETTSSEPLQTMAVGSATTKGFLTARFHTWVLPWCTRIPRLCPQSFCEKCVNLEHSFGH